MMPIVGIGIMSIIISGIVGMYIVIDTQQELSEINVLVQEKNIEISSELINIKGINTNTGSIEFSNSQNEEIKIIQIRVYDEFGNFVESFDIDEIISGNSEIEISSLPMELQEMLVQ